MNQKKQPMRMCVVCRQMKPKVELARVIVDDGHVCFDSTGKKNGRGAYICKDEKCFQNAKKRGSIARNFSITMTDEDYKSLEEQMFGKD